MQHGSTVKKKHGKIGITKNIMLKQNIILAYTSKTLQK